MHLNASVVPKNSSFTSRRQFPTELNTNDLTVGACIEKQQL